MIVVVSHKKVVSCFLPAESPTKVVLSLYKSPQGIIFDFLYLSNPQTPQCCIPISSW